MITQINQGTNLKSTRTLWGLSTYKLVCVPCLFLLKKKKKKKKPLVCVLVAQLYSTLLQPYGR